MKRHHLRFQLILYALLLTFKGSAQLFEDITKNLLLTGATSGFGYGSGVSAEDFDKDGDLDIVLCTDVSSASRILVNNGASYTEKLFFLNFNSRVALWMDYDGDHLLDLMFIGDCLGLDASCNQSIALFRQSTTGDFENVTDVAGLAQDPHLNDAIISGASAGDLNDDGFLDVIIVTFDKESLYLENQGNGTFEKIFDPFKRGKTQDWTPILFDFNRDGWLDYYQAVDFYVPNEFWSHSGDLNFNETANEIGLDHSTEDMGIALGDFDNDSDLDVYISCIQPEDTARGNVLLKNNGGIYEDISFQSDIYKAGWSWGVTFFDANNDGFLDIAATNGFRENEYDSSKFWLNRGDGTFIDNSNEVLFNDTLQATSLISLDFDRDGDLDLIQTLKAEYHEDAFRLLRNDLSPGPNQNYIVIKPRMSGTNHWGIGSLVKIKTTNGQQIRPITAGIGFFSQEPAEAFFGLGDVSIVDEIVIEWPGGGQSVLYSIPSNQVLEINDSDALHPPRNLRVKSIDSVGFMLEWDRVSFFTHNYLLEKSTSPIFDQKKSLEIISDEYYIDNSFDKDSIYYYRVSSVNEDDISRASLVVEAKYQETLISPSDLRFEVISLTSIRLEWSDNSNNEDGFEIHRSLSENFDNYLSFRVEKDATSYIDNTLEPKTKYYYRIKSYSRYGESPFSPITLVDLTALAVNTREKQTMLYPNPAKSVINIKSDEQVAVIKIIDLSGNTIARYSYFKDSSFITDITSGTYIIEILYNNGRFETQKLVIE